MTNLSRFFIIMAAFAALISGRTAGAQTHNVASGEEALSDVTTGSFNVADGFTALQLLSTGDDNTAVGAFTLLTLQEGGDGNTAIGAAALNQTSGSYNTARGAGALEDQVFGANNIALGAFAGARLVTGSNDVYIGNEDAIHESATIRIGSSNQTRTFIAGISGAPISGSPVYISQAGQLGVLGASVQFKRNVKDIGTDSHALLSLRPVSFECSPSVDPSGQPQFGLIAEDVERVDPRLVNHGPDGVPVSVRYEAINTLLLNEFLKQHSTVEEQQAQIQGQATGIRLLKQENEALRARMEAMERALQMLERFNKN